MARESVSTEGRIFARQLAREAKRREAVGAMALGNALTYDNAAIATLKLFHQCDGPVKTIIAMRKVIKRLEQVPADDRSFYFPPGASEFRGKRQAILTIYTLMHGCHPISSIETGILVSRHTYYSSRRMLSARVSDELAFISDHTLGRLHERADDSWGTSSVFGLSGMLALIGEIGMGMALVHNDRPGTQLNVVVSQMMLTGSMRHVKKTDPGGSYFQPFFDVRTALPVDANGVSDEQRSQAKYINTLINACITNDVPMQFLADGKLVEEIPYIERREDYITDLINKTALQADGPMLGSSNQ